MGTETLKRGSSWGDQHCPRGGPGSPDHETTLDHVIQRGSQQTLTFSRLQQRASVQRSISSDTVRSGRGVVRNKDPTDNPAERLCGTRAGARRRGRARLPRGRERAGPSGARAHLLGFHAQRPRHSVSTEKQWPSQSSSHLFFHHFSFYFHRSSVFVL